jgi:hemoglobin-like flavoprotein
MIRPQLELVEMFARMASNYPEVAKWLNEWRQHELEQLPNVSTAAVATAQGRCQVLTELCKLVNNSRDLTAQSKKR